MVFFLGRMKASTSKHRNRRVHRVIPVEDQHFQASKANARKVQPHMRRHWRRRFVVLFLVTFRRVRGKRDDQRRRRWLCIDGGIFLRRRCGGPIWRRSLRQRRRWCCGGSVFRFRMSSIFWVLILASLIFHLLPCLIDWLINEDENERDSNREGDVW